MGFALTSDELQWTTYLGAWLLSLVVAGLAVLIIAFVPYT
jgi:hypothetical protein